MKVKDSRKKYQDALKSCSCVAREEFKAAKKAFGDAEQTGKKLKDTIEDLVLRTPSDGAAVETARTRLHELSAKLETTLNNSLTTARIDLDTKQRALGQFTVTLFGRTMAGKSTIREALTRGDGTTIGKGAQRTTRDVREYTWNSLRIIDTPGIGAYEGDADRANALSVIDETDIVLFLVSSDGIQEESFKGMQALRQQNKPLLFVLNVKRDLEKPVYMRRFLADPRSVFDDDELRGHFDRIHRLAGEFLGIRDIRIIPIHAQAAFLSTRPEHEKHSDALAEHSSLGNLLEAIEKEVLCRGTVRRVQTVVDGTLVSLLNLQEELAGQAKAVKQTATYLKDKFSELNAWLNEFVKSIDSRSKAETSQLINPLRISISSFIDENIERQDVAERWKLKTKSLGIDAWLKQQQSTILDELHGRLDEFSREMAVERTFMSEFDMGPTQFDPWDVKRTLNWVSAGGAAIGGVAAVALLLGGANWWNPVGWVAGGVGLIALGVSWLFEDRETTLQRQKSVAIKQLRDSIDKLEQNIANNLKEWFDGNVNDRIVSAIRNDTQQFYNGMFDVARALDDGSLQIGAVVERLNRRLLVRTGQFVGVAITEDRIVRIVRDPGVRAKLLWRDSSADDRFCKEVGIAIGEWVDGVPEVPLPQKIAWALRPASVSPANISVSGQNAIARISKSEVGRAIGRRGNNVSLASRLIGIRIKVINQE